MTSSDARAVAELFARLRTAPDFTLDEVADFAVTSHDNRTLLQEAIARRPALATPLVGRGVPLDHRDDDGRTALQYALARSMGDLARALVRHGARLDLLDTYGNGALWTAVMAPRPDVPLIIEMIQAGADPHVRNRAGRSAADLIRAKGMRAAIAVLDVR